MELMEGIQTRKSIRAFKPAPVPREMIEKILEAAGRSPSFTNTQPWEVAVVTGSKITGLSKILSDAAKARTPTNPDVPWPKGWPPELDKRGKEHGERRYAALGIARDDRERRIELGMLNYKFYGAPCVLYLMMDSTLASWSIFDMGLFAQSVALAAHGLGLGTCIQASLTSYPDAVRGFLGIPKTKLLLVGMSLGYPDPANKLNDYRSSRANLSEFVQWHA